VRSSLPWVEFSFWSLSQVLKSHSLCNTNIWGPLLTWISINPSCNKLKRAKEHRRRKTTVDIRCLGWRVSAQSQDVRTVGDLTCSPSRGSSICPSLMFIVFYWITDTSMVAHSFRAKEPTQWHDIIIYLGLNFHLHLHTWVLTLASLSLPPQAYAWLDNSQALCSSLPANLAVWPCTIRLSTPFRCSSQGFHTYPQHLLQEL
jgi:hypothetical protein